MTDMQCCWQFQKCGCEEGGSNSHVKGPCPAAMEKRLNGTNRGKNAGRSCWVMDKTFNGNEDKAYYQKLGGCFKCPHMSSVRTGEGDRFNFGLDVLLADLDPKMLSVAMVMYHELMMVYNDLTQTKQQLIQAEKTNALGKMAGSMAHEFNTPLGSLLLNIGMLNQAMEAGNAGMMKKITTSMEGIAKHLRGIVTNFRSFTRSGIHEPMRPEKLGGIFDNTRALVSQLASDSGIALEFKLQEDVEIRCRSVEIVQVLINLIQNAIEAVKGGGNPRIEIKGSKAAGHAMIEVCDNGREIPRGIKEQMMQPFFTTKDKERGTGLGLTVCKNIAENHQGSFMIDMESSHTRFILKLPLDGGNTGDRSQK